MLRKISRIFFRVLLSIVLFVGIYAAAAFSLPYLELNNTSEALPKDVEIYVRSNGVHTDFVLPIRSKFFDWSSKIPFSDFEEVDSTFQFIELGWGDRGFYLETPTWDDLKFSTAFNAAFGLGSTAMHVSYRRYPPRTGDLCRKLTLSERQYGKLVGYALLSFKRINGKPVAIEHPGYSEQDCFYEANGSYSMFKTCNVWTGEGLRFINRRCGLWTPFHRGVIDHCE